MLAWNIWTTWTRRGCKAEVELIRAAQVVKCMGTWDDDEGLVWSGR